MFEYFIAKRYLKSKHKLNFITIISLLSTVGITLGVAALIIVLSVFNGFGSLVQSILINIDPHLRITAVSSEGYDTINKIASEFGSTPHIKHFSPFVEGKTIAYNDNSFEILTLKGISDSSNSDWGLKKSVMTGAFNLGKSGRLNNIVLGLPMALRLSLRIGDTLSITSANKIERAITSMSIPATRRFILSGIFESNNRDFDLAYAFCSIAAAQSVLGLKNKITGMEFYLDDISRSEGMKDELLEKYGNSSIKIETWYDLHEELYGMMMIERWVAYILLCLIIAVATFNILGSLTVSVVEKQKDIGILRAMGTTEQSIKKIFMLEGILVGVIGTVLGAIIGLGICYIQINYNIYPLDPTKYIIDSLPMQVRLSDTIIIIITSLILSLLAAVYPAKKATKISLIDSIKWE
jgi:lipoprotein-releasing system permease protein